MLIGIIILYFVVALIVSIVFTYMLYRTGYSYKDIKSFLEDDIDWGPCVLTGLFFPVTLIVMLSMHYVPFVFLHAMKWLDKKFGGKKND